MLVVKYHYCWCKLSSSEAYLVVGCFRTLGKMWAIVHVLRSSVKKQLRQILGFPLSSHCGRKYDNSSI